MPHRVSGYDLAYTGRGSRWAHLTTLHGVHEIIPVAWMRDWEPVEKILVIFYEKPDDFNNARNRTTPFKVAVAVEKDDREEHPKFKTFHTVVEVESTGEQRPGNGLVTKVVGRPRGAYA